MKKDEQEKLSHISKIKDAITLIFKDYQKDKQYFDFIEEAIDNICMRVEGERGSFWIRILIVETCFNLCLKNENKEHDNLNRDINNQTIITILYRIFILSTDIRYYHPDIDLNRLVKGVILEYVDNAGLRKFLFELFKNVKSY